MKTKGSILIEVLIVVAILGIIAAAIIPNISRFMQPEDVVIEPPSITDAPYQMLITTNCAIPKTVLLYCPEGGYNLTCGCVLLTEYYILDETGQNDRYVYTNSTRMYCGEYVQKVDVIDRR